MTVKVSPKYQVVIPEEVRKSIHLKPGMEVNVISKGSVIYIIPIRSLEETGKALAGKFSVKDLAGYREKKDRKV